MKRLVADLSSESEDDLDISKIKKAYGKPTKRQKANESLTQNSKSKKQKTDDKQLTLDYFNNNKSNSNKKPLDKGTLDTFLIKKTESKKQDKSIVKSISANDYFGTKASAKKEVKTVKSQQKKESFDDEDSFLMDVSFEDDTDDKKLTIKAAKSPMKTPIKNESFSHKTPEKNTLNKSQMDTPKSGGKFNFHAYINRPGPSALGSKEIPQGNPNCLVGMTFVITGVLDSIERDDAQSLIESCGGRVTKAISGKTTYLVIGNEPGQSKINKANQCNTKQINEDELFDLIRTNSAKFPQSTSKKTSEVIKQEPSNKLTAKPLVNNNIKSEVRSVAKSMKSEEKSARPVKTENKLSNNENQTKSTQQDKKSYLLVDKYQPSSFTQIVGQQGDASAANKLKKWLTNWYDNYKTGFSGSSSDPSNKFRAVLLAGPPGIGKTTTANLVARSLGFDVVELNASCTRNKSQLTDLIPHITNNQHLANPFNKSQSISSSSSMRRCLIMDEVDGMAGNADRGGVQALIQCIKSTHHPIICICNDKSSQKMRSLVNYLYDLQFRRPTHLQIKAAISSILCREGFSDINSTALDALIVSCNFDLRQIINNVQLWDPRDNSQTNSNHGSSQVNKDVKLKPFDVVCRVFDHQHCTNYWDKSQLFFYDYQLSGLFVHENYLSVLQPSLAKSNPVKTMKLMSLAADSQAIGDIISANIYSKNDWSLLPTQALFSSVIPGEYLHGKLSAMARFPGWLGRNSTMLKRRRMGAEMARHLRLSGGAGAGGYRGLVEEDQGRLILARLIGPLREGDVDQVVCMLDALKMHKDDVEVLSELIAFTPAGCSSLYKDVSSNLKSALTRAYNKSGNKLPYTLNDGKSGSSKSKAIYSEPALLGPDDNAEEEIAPADDSEDETEVIKPKSTASKKSKVQTATTKRKAQTTTSSKSTKKTKSK